MIVITDKEFKELAGYIKNNYGIHLKTEKQALVIGRLQNVLMEMGFDNFTDYYHYLKSETDRKAVTTLVDKITTNHTYFMREAEHFHFFRDKVLPYLTNTVRDRDLRIWCAACSSGEESYTLAMILDEHFGKEKIWWDHQVLATDISDQVLNIARQGIYSNERIACLPPHWKMNYLKKYDATNYIIAEKIRKQVIYRRFNLMENIFPFKRKFHTIFCRNVMIYFDQHTKTELVNKFYNMMEYGGYLFIGHSESLNRDLTNFKYIMPAVYRKE